MTRALRAFAALTLLAAPLAGQGPIADRMLTLAGHDHPADTSSCKLSGGDFHTASSGTYLHTALGTPVPDNKKRALTAGRDQAIQGIQAGQAGSTKAWYFLARIDLQLGDLVGADTAFAQLLKRAPACAGEVDIYRRVAWGTLMNAAVSARAAGQVDSSVIFARAVNQIDATRPQGWYTIGAYFLDQHQDDSAKVYLQKAFLAPSDTSAITQGVRQGAAYQFGVIAYNDRDYAGAVQGFSLALKLKADDADARRNLVVALRQAGMTDSATKVAATITAEPGADAAAGNEQLFNIGVDQFNAHKYADAAGTFEKIIATEPNNRDALFNLANAYLGLQDGDKLLATALKLQSIDPLSFEVLQLVANGYRIKHDQPNTMRSAIALGSSTVSLSVAQGGFVPAADKATLTFTATGRDGRDANDRPVRAAAIPIVVEFLNKDGAVVTAAESTVPALAANATQQIAVTGTGAGITAWRYHKK